MRKLGLAAIALLIVVAGGLMLAHLRLPGGAETFRMEASRVQPYQEAPVVSENGTIAVNRASSEELDQLPGVGPAIAQRIIDERNQNGAFHYPEDLLSVQGIGEKTLEKLKDQILLP